MRQGLCRLLRRVSAPFSTSIHGPPFLSLSLSPSLIVMPHPLPPTTIHSTTTRCDAMRASPSRIFTPHVDVIHCYDYIWCVACIYVFLCNAFYSDTATTTNKRMRKKDTDKLFTPILCAYAHTAVIALPYPLQS